MIGRFGYGSRGAGRQAGARLSRGLDPAEVLSAGRSDGGLFWRRRLCLGLRGLRLRGHLGCRSGFRELRGGLRLRRPGGLFVAAASLRLGLGGGLFFHLAGERPIKDLANGLAGLLDASPQIGDLRL